MKDFSRLSPTEMLSSFRDSIRELGSLRREYSQGKISKDEYKALSGKVKGEITGKMLEMGSCRKSILEDIMLRSFGVSPSEVSGAKTFSELVDTVQLFLISPNAVYITEQSIGTPFGRGTYSPDENLMTFELRVQKNSQDWGYGGYSIYKERQPAVISYIFQVYRG